MGFRSRVHVHDHDRVFLFGHRALKANKCMLTTICSNGGLG